MKLRPINPADHFSILVGGSASRAVSRRMQGSAPASAGLPPGISMPGVLVHPLRISACGNVTMCCCWCGTTLCLWQGVYPGFQPKEYPAVPGLEGEHEPAGPPLMLPTCVAASLPCGDRMLHAWHQATPCHASCFIRSAMPCQLPAWRAMPMPPCTAMPPRHAHAMPCHAMPCHDAPCTCHAHAAPPMPQAWAWWRRTALAPPSLRWGSVWWAPPLTPSMVSEPPGAQCGRHCAWHVCRTTMGMLVLVRLMLGRLHTACRFAYARIALHPCIHAPMLQAAPARGSSTCWWARAAWPLCRTPSAMMLRHK